ncbi:type II toxin-antitoxin system HicB family antitoxin [Thermodesulfovibrio sp.]|jgi:predicted RNase H-like HicB family nuclease|uniref:type II toxin-antitoxin system HicB family antitoxin n=1 Tax=Thermodesulfovibrio TaxID=28261 RepID=UPI002615548A|nr:type II toxin-antitoxin system HicB family antitoxin [Thermodesulfovibrio sp.]
MLVEYIEEALRRAKYEIIEDEEPYYGEVSELPGVWATGKTLEECRENLKQTIESWIIISIKKGLPLPKLGNLEIKDFEECVV